MNPERAISPAAKRRVCKTLGRDCETSEKSAEISVPSVGNGVTVAQQTLTLFVLVRIQVPQPVRKDRDARSGSQRLPQNSSDAPPLETLSVVTANLATVDQAFRLPCRG
jgi:hypothetical protein